MSFFSKKSEICICEPRKELNVVKIVFKTIAITFAVLVFIPTLFVKREDGFDGYGLLSHVGYRKSTDKDGKKRRDVSVTLMDLSRYGVENKRETVEEENEDSISIEK